MTYLIGAYIKLFLYLLQNVGLCLKFLSYSDTFFEQNKQTEQKML